eukprot:7277585-Ditylum_brightwellii.AAC.1
MTIRVVGRHNKEGSIYICIAIRIRRFNPNLPCSPVTPFTQDKETEEIKGEKRVTKGKEEEVTRTTHNVVGEGGKEEGTLGKTNDKGKDDKGKVTRQRKFRG